MWRTTLEGGTVLGSKGLEAGLKHSNGVPIQRGEQRKKYELKVKR